MIGKSVTGPPRVRTIRGSLGVLTLLFFVGCGGEPQLHKITGKVTLDGESYNRLLVYMRPPEGQVNQYNLGVGETNDRGELTLRSTAGPGIPEGEYLVSFSCMVSPSGEVLAGDEKHDDDPEIYPEEIVPEPYCSDENSPVRFEVTREGPNFFEYDIPSGQ